MLGRGIKCITVMMLLFITACNQQEKKDKERAIKLLEMSKSTVGGPNTYHGLYKQCLDSLNAWCSAKLPGYESVYYDRTYRIDSVLCFNRERDRMVTAILVQCNEPVCETDAVKYFYGAKIKGQWYFFQGGGTMVIIREHYQKDIHTPVGFAKLHELAMDEMLRGYIKRNREGEWEVNDAFFTHHFEGVNWGDFNKQTHQDTVAYGKRFTNKKEYFEAIYQYVSTGQWPKREEKKANKPQD